MSGHRSSRRRDYGRRQKDVRARRGIVAIPIEIEAPILWARGRSWDAGPTETDAERLTSPGERRFVALHVASASDSMGDRAR